MKSKRLRIFTFVSLSIFLGILLSGVVLITASNLIHNKQHNQIQLVEQFTYSNLGDNAKLLSKQLRGAVELEFLTITDDSGNVLYRYIEPEYNAPLITPILKSLSIYTEPASLITSNEELHIEFHSSYDQFLRPFTHLLYFMFFAPGLILGINMLIKVNNSAKTLPGKDEGDHPAKDNKLDKLTGLPGGPEFIEHFESLIKEKQGLHNGHFLLIRATQLQHLNFNLGYPAGDRYIQLIGFAITAQLTKDTNLQAFKLNGFDFGLILPNYSAEQSEQLISQITEQFKESFLEENVSSELSIATLFYDETTDVTTLVAQANAQVDAEPEDTKAV
jgi:GGDEF domain-containing protein